MKKFKLTAVAGAAVILAGAFGVTGAQAGVLINGGFETGDLTGWTAVSPNAGAATSYGAFTPVTGNFLGFVQAGCGANAYCTLSQTFTMNAGQTVSGSVGFQANDYLPFNDYADLSINGATLFSSNVAAVGDFGNSGWQAFTYVAPSSGSYTLKLEVANDIDNSLPSGAVLDNVSVSAAVPEPAIWTMMILGVAFVGFALRRRRGASLALA